MRLLNAITKRLESFFDNRTPGYTILSHMWGKGEDEVLFKHVAGSEDDRFEGETRRGYEKLTAACKQTIKDGWNYIWIDTCCIDKESSAELSEAINSMYAWYRGSRVCYAYLEDVQSHGDIRSGSKNSTFEIVPFEGSRWFSRGWTLQELIAPRRVVFYSSNWTDIGTKATLQDSISSITRIRVEMIVAYDPKKASIAERMSWAAERRTTRREDIAYCLMGLFSVNIPLLYGEGDRAFMRLQEEIMRTSDDHSLFAWITPDVDRPRGLLAASPGDFYYTGNVQSDEKGAYSAYSMTNKGLQIELPLLPVDYKEVGSKNTFKAVLRCTYRDKVPTQWIVIYLTRIREDYYVRVFPKYLGETYMNPSGLQLTPLVITQVDTPIGSESWGYNDIKVKVLPTESGFIFEGESLTEGCDHTAFIHGRPVVLIFVRQEERFGIVIGNNHEVPWLDIIPIPGIIGEITSTVIEEINSYYDEGGSRYSAVLRSLDRLSVDISKGWAVTVSVGVIPGKYYRQDTSSTSIRAIIDIQRAPK